MYRYPHWGLSEYLFVVNLRISWHVLKWTTDDTSSVVNLLLQSVQLTENLVWVEASFYLFTSPTMLHSLYYMSSVNFFSDLDTSLSFYIRYEFIFNSNENELIFINSKNIIESSIYLLLTCQCRRIVPMSFIFCLIFKTLTFYVVHFKFLTGYPIGTRCSSSFFFINFFTLLYFLSDIQELSSNLRHSFFHGHLNLYSIILTWLDFLPLLFFWLLFVCRSLRTTYCCSSSCSRDLTHPNSVFFYELFHYRLLTSLKYFLKLYV